MLNLNTCKGRGAIEMKQFHTVWCPDGSAVRWCGRVDKCHVLCAQLPYFYDSIALVNESVLTVKLIGVCRFMNLDFKFEIPMQKNQKKKQCKLKTALPTYV